MKELYQKFISNECTEAEITLLLREFAAAGNEAQLRALIMDQLEQTGDINEELMPDLDVKEDQLYASILSGTELHQQLFRSPGRQVGISWLRIAAAASIIMLFLAGGYFLLHHPVTTVPVVETAENRGKDIPPGTNGAILTLGNGQKIALEETKTGAIASQNGTNLAKTNDNSLVYQAGKATAETKILYNTLETPRGRQYSVVLPDGTRVWLNAASSITYPTAFTGKERKVTMTGEAYFQVAHHAAIPFKVEVNGETIEDIGTEFNVNAYRDEPASNTTLISGSVKVTAGSQAAVLHPGKTAIIEEGKPVLIKDADIEAVTAWKNGYFIFNDEDLHSVMRKIGRWYDVEVRYTEGQNISESYFGSVTRFDKVSSVLDLLEATGKVRFKVEGRTIVVMKKKTND